MNFAHFEEFFDFIFSGIKVKASNKDFWLLLIISLILNWSLLLLLNWLLNLYWFFLFNRLRLLRLRSDSSYEEDFSDSDSDFLDDLEDLEDF